MDQSSTKEYAPKNYAVVQTVELPFLVSCVEKATYGVSDRTVKHDDVFRVLFNKLEISDVVFIRYSGMICGPIFIREPAEGIEVKENNGVWYRVNEPKTLDECKPGWLALFPWCIFFDI